MRVETDSEQRAKAGLSFCLEFYKILMGTFLTAFVPRNCGESICTVTENINDEEVFHRLVISFNAFSFLTFLAFYYAEVSRENWAIEYLDIDPDKPNNNLDEEIENYPAIKDKMLKLNKNYLNSTKFCTALQVINIGLSTADIGSHWAGAATVTPLLSSILLIFMKLYASYNVAKASLHEERAFSAYLSIPRTFNTIDEDYRVVDADTVCEDLEEQKVIEHSEAENVVDNIQIEMIETNDKEK